MLGMLAASAAVFTQNEFLGSVGFVSFGDVIEMPAFGAF